MFCRSRVISAGVDDSVMFEIASSSTLWNSRDPHRRTAVADEHAALDARQPLGLEQRVGVGDDVADAEAAIELVERRRAIRARDTENCSDARSLARHVSDARGLKKLFESRGLPVIAARTDDEREIGTQREPHASVDGRVLLARRPASDVDTGGADDGVPRLVDVGRRLPRPRAPTSTSAAFQVRIHWPPAGHEIARDGLIVGQPFALAIGGDGRERLEVVLAAAGDARRPEAARQRRRSHRPTNCRHSVSLTCTGVPLPRSLVRDVGARTSRASAPLP